MEDADEQPSIKLHNDSVLDCPICFRPLTIPVFECDYNGHIACSSCHTEIRIRKGKCPTCSMRLGDLRNRAIESVLESLEISCSYKINGCPAKILYSNKRSHEDTCGYAALFTCPFPGCNFRGSLWFCLYEHLLEEEQHTSSVFLLESSNSGRGRVQFSLGEADKIVAFLQVNYCSLIPCTIFVLNMKDGRLRINTIQDPQEYSHGCNIRYMLTARHTSSGCFKFESVTSPLRDADIVAAGSNSLSGDFPRLLGYFFGDDRRITLELMIWADDES